MLSFAGLYALQICIAVVLLCFHFIYSRRSWAPVFLVLAVLIAVWLLGVAGQFSTQWFSMSAEERRDEVLSGGQFHLLLFGFPVLTLAFAVASPFIKKKGPFPEQSTRRLRYRASYWLGWVLLAAPFVLFRAYHWYVFHYAKDRISTDLHGEEDQGVQLATIFITSFLPFAVLCLGDSALAFLLNWKSSTLCRWLALLPVIALGFLLTLVIFF